MRRVLFLVFAAVGISLSAQNIGVKTNLLYDLTSTINLGAEIGLAPKWTLDLSGNYNAWAFKNDKKWKHWMAQPEARYWFCEAFNGHFLGLHLLGGQFNVGNVDPIIYPSAEGKRYEGFYYGAGLAYGYQWILGNHWSLEASIGVGYERQHYDEYDCPTCGEWRGEGKKNYFGVTKAAISLIYVIK